MGTRRSGKAAERRARAAERRALRAELRQEVKQAAQRRRAALAALRAECREWRKLAREEARARRRRLVEAARAAYREDLARARAACRQAKDHVLTTFGRTAGEARGKVRAAERFARLREAAAARLASTVKAATRAALAPSDQEVKAELPESLHPLWELHAHKVKPTPNKSRTEVFLAHAHKHPEKALQAAGDTGASELREVEREAAALAPRAAAPRVPGHVLTGEILARVRASADSWGLAEIAPIVRDLSQGARRSDVEAAFLRLQRGGLLELRPETSPDLLTDEQRRWSLPGARGGLLTLAAELGSPRPIPERPAPVGPSAMDLALAHGDADRAAHSHEAEGRVDLAAKKHAEKEAIKVELEAARERERNAQVAAELRAQVHEHRYVAATQAPRLSAEEEYRLEKLIEKQAEKATYKARLAALNAALDTVIAGMTERRETMRGADMSDAAQQLTFAFPWSKKLLLAFGLALEQRTRRGLLVCRDHLSDPPIKGKNLARLFRGELARWGTAYFDPAPSAREHIPATVRASLIGTADALGVSRRRIDVEALLRNLAHDHTRGQLNAGLIALVRERYFDLHFPHASERIGGEKNQAAFLRKRRPDFQLSRPGFPGGLPAV